MKVLIVGGGIGGLCLAQGLRKAGIAFQFFERQTSPSENLAGYGIHIDANGQRALQRCLDDHGWDDFWTQSTAAGSDVAFRDTDLNLLAGRRDAPFLKSAQAVNDETGLRGIGRIELRQILLDGLSPSCIHWGKIFERYELLEGDRVRAYFPDGTHENGDVLIGADGCKSRVRNQCLPRIERIDLGILVIAGRYILDEEQAAQLPLSLTSGSPNSMVPIGKGWMFSCAWRSRESVELNDSDKGTRYIVWAYVVPQEETPPHIESLSPEQLRQIALTGIKGWGKHLITLIEDTDMSTIAAVPLRSMPYLDSWSPSIVTVLGDAIHNMTPMGGIGANTALRDAEILAGVLASAVQECADTVSAIASYESAMREYANFAVGVSRNNANRAASFQPFQRILFRWMLQLCRFCSQLTSRRQA